MILISSDKSPSYETIQAGRQNDRQVEFDGDEILRHRHNQRILYFKTIYMKRYIQFI